MCCLQLCDCIEDASSGLAADGLGCHVSPDNGQTFCYVNSGGMGSAPSSKNPGYAMRPCLPAAIEVAIAEKQAQQRQEIQALESLD